MIGFSTRISILACVPEVLPGQPLPFIIILGNIDAFDLENNRSRAVIAEADHDKIVKIVVMLSPLVTDLMYQATYDWYRCKGSFSLRRKARTWAEVAFYVAPDYRWGPEKADR